MSFTIYRTASSLTLADETQTSDPGRCLVFRIHVGGFMASGAKNQLPLVNDLGAPTLRDGSVGRWNGKESFFPDGFDVGGHP